MPPKIVLTWLPFRPILYGLWVGIELLIAILLFVFVFKWSFDWNNLLFVFVFPVGACLVAYWVPVAYLVRKIYGTPFEISLI